MTNRSVIKQIYDEALRHALAEHEDGYLQGFYATPERTSRHLRPLKLAYELFSGRRLTEPSDAELTALGWSAEDISEFHMQVVVLESRGPDWAVDEIVDRYLKIEDLPEWEHRHFDEMRRMHLNAAFGGFLDAIAKVEAALKEGRPPISLGADPETPPAGTGQDSQLVNQLISALGNLTAPTLAKPRIPADWLGQTVQQAMQRYFDESAKGRDASADSKRRALDAASLLDGVTGGRPCYEVSQDHLKRLNRVFDELPLNRGKSAAERHLSLNELLELTKDRLASG